jgi:hypothetical protein
MNNTLTKVCSAALLALAAGCGGSDGNAAVGKTFNYGAAQPPTSTETSAVTSASSGVTASSGFSSAPSADKGFALVGMLSELSAALGGFSVPGMSRNIDITRPLRQGATAATFDTCATVTQTSATFNNCSLSESGLNMTLNGSVTVTAGTVAWNVTMNLSGSENGETINVSDHAAGNLTVTATNVKGQSTTEVSGSFSGNGQSVSFGVSLAAILDVTTASTCNSGVVAPSSIEVKRVWTSHPSGQGADQLFTDAGIKVTWTGCGAFTVAHSQ